MSNNEQKDQCAMSDAWGALYNGESIEVDQAACEEAMKHMIDMMEADQWHKKVDELLSMQKRDKESRSIKPGDRITFSGLHRLPDGSMMLGKPHKKHRKDKMPVFVVKEVI